MEPVSTSAESVRRAARTTTSFDHGYVTGLKPSRIACPRTVGCSCSGGYWRCVCCVGRSWCAIATLCVSQRDRLPGGRGVTVPMEHRFGGVSSRRLRHAALASSPAMVGIRGSPESERQAPGRYTTCREVRAHGCGSLPRVVRVTGQPNVIIDNVERSAVLCLRFLTRRAYLALPLAAMPGMRRAIYLLS